MREGTGTTGAYAMGGPATLTAEIRRVLARVDAHAAHAGQEEKAGPSDSPQPPDSTPVPACPPPHPSTP